MRASIVAMISALTLALAVAVQASASTLRPAAACGSVVGLTWEMQAFGKKGTSWTVGAKGVQCSFAKRWAARLVRTPWRGEAGTKLRGPAGWACLPTVGGALSTRGTPGNCRKGAKSFFWGPKA